MDTTVIKTGLKIELLPNLFANKDGTLDLEKAKIFSGKAAGMCYDLEGYSKLDQEDVDKSLNRAFRTAKSGHHSVYDHVYLNFNFEGIYKIVAMFINNEKQYTTSEKSARYTPVVKDEFGIISETEVDLYDKWKDIFIKLIKERYPLNNYPHLYPVSKKSGQYLMTTIEKKAQENARYLITVFMPTKMIYSTTLRQINYLASWMNRFIADCDLNNDFEIKVADQFREFVLELTRLNVLDHDLMLNEKNRCLSLYVKDLPLRDDYFGRVYSTTYKGSLAQLAQAQRHRTLSYAMSLLDNEYFVPPILLDCDDLINEWLNDMKSVAHVYPQGQMVLIREEGTYDNLILKAKERLCTHAQLEINDQTKDTLTKAYQYFVLHNDLLQDDIIRYLKGARCTFYDYKCSEDCKFKEGKTLKRKV